MISTFNGACYEIIDSLTIKKKIKDLHQLQQLDQLFFPMPWSSASWEDFVSHDEYLIIMAKDSETQELIGFSLYKLNTYEDLAHMVKFVLHPTFRKLGHGRQMLILSIDYLFDSCIEKIYLEVNTSNNRTIKIYVECGFKKMHESKQFYSNGDDAYVMMLEKQGCDASGPPNNINN